MNTYVVIVIGLGGDERYLSRPGETADERQADRFPTEAKALEAGRAHIETFPACITRHMSIRAEPSTVRRSRSCAAAESRSA